MSELLPLPRAARRVGVPIRWLKDEADSGRIPCLRADSSFLFDEETLIESLRIRASGQTSARQTETHGQKSPA